MKVVYSKDFIKSTKILGSAQKLRLVQRIELLLTDPRNTQLRNHKLSGRWSGYSSINITGDLRAVFEQSNGEIYFIALGSHAKLYK